MKILLVQLGRLGDVLLTTPAIRAIRAKYPDATLEFLTKRPFAPVLEGNPNLDAIRVHDDKIGSDAKIVFESLFSRRYDAVVDFQSTPHSSVLVAATRAPIRIGLDRRHRIGYTHRVRLKGTVPYSAAHKIEMLEPLGVEGGSLRLDLFPSASDREFAMRLWDRLGWHADAPVAILSPVSRRARNRWPLEKFAVVGDILSKRFGGRLLITSGPGERAVAAGVASLMEEPAVWDYPATTIKQLAAIYERAAFWFGCDNGPKHLACAMDVPTVTLFRNKHGAAFTNPEVPAQWIVEAPDDGQERVVERLPLELALATLDSALADAWARWPRASALRFILNPAGALIGGNVS